MKENKKKTTTLLNNFIDSNPLDNHLDDQYERDNQSGIQPSLHESMALS
jgi:hypothetical protein